MVMERPMPPSHPFSSGRPKEQVYQTVSTTGLPPVERYAMWAEEVIRGFHVGQADARQRRDFQATATSVAHAEGEMHHVVSNGYKVFQPRELIHDELALFLMLEGHADVLYQDGAAYRTAPGHFFLLDGPCTRSIEWSDRHAVIQLDLPRSQFESAVPAVREGAAQINAALARSPLTALLRSQIAQFPVLAPCLAEAEQQAMLYASESLAIAVVAGACNSYPTGAHSPHARLFAAARRHIERHLPSPNLTPGSIAAAIGCSRSMLYKVFAQNGLAVQGYIRELRLQRIRGLLLQDKGRTPLYLLAERCGFDDASNFSRLYRRRFGVAPGQERG